MIASTRHVKIRHLPCETESLYVRESHDDTLDNVG
jgi:hypothetical protein